MEDLNNYRPNENPKIIPEDYRLCEHLGKAARVDLFGNAITCTAKCPYGNQGKRSVNWEAEGGQRYVCLTKGLVKKIQQEKSQ